MHMIDDEQPEEEMEAAGGEGAGGDEGELDIPGGSTADALEDEEQDAKNRLILIVAGAVILLVALIGGLFFTGMLDGLLGKKPECVEEYDADGVLINECPEEEKDMKEEAKDSKDDKGKDGKKGSSTNFLVVPPMIVNLNSDDDGTPRYLRLRVQLEMYKSSDVVTVELVLPRVVDKFQTYLRELRVKDLRGSAGIYRLQTELLWRVNQAVHPVKVKDVLFQEILIQ